MSKINLSIPEPCHEKWDNMTAVEKGRFCNSCQKVVVDFSSMSDAQLIAYFKAPKDSVCGRFDKEQLDRDIIVSKKRMPWIRYFFGLAFPAFLLSLKSNGQSGRTVGKIKVTTEKSPETAVASGTIVEKGLKVIKGNVCDEKGEGIANATVLVKGTNRGVVTDSEGNFLLKEAGKSFVLQFLGVGYETVEYKVNDSMPVKINMILNQHRLGEVVVTGYAIPRRKKTVPLIQRIMPDTLFKTFKVYPNPVKAGNGIIVENKNLSKGDHVLTIMSTGGHTLIAQKWLIDGKRSSLQTTIPVSAVGSCVISVRNVKTGVLYSEKLLVTQ
jgi:hypothetical protein